MNDHELAQRIRNDGIDILVDLAGHTAGGALKTFSYRPAPIQATYLGYFASTGLEVMDYWISDEMAHPVDRRAYLQTPAARSLPPRPRIQSQAIASSGRWKTPRSAHCTL